METERRSAPRFHINQLIGYFPNREEYLWAEGLDLSEGGMHCSSASPVDPLTNVYMMIAFPCPEGEHLIRLEGFVAHSHMENGRCNFGVKFERMSDEDRQFLKEYIATHCESDTP